jgi:hypothetical protein
MPMVAAKKRSQGSDDGDHHQRHRRALEDHGERATMYTPAVTMVAAWIKRRPEWDLPWRPAARHKEESAPTCRQAPTISSKPMAVSRPAPAVSTGMRGSPAWQRRVKFSVRSA